jgi:hypothetical protein
VLSVGGEDSEFNSPKMTKVINSSLPFIFCLGVACAALGLILLCALVGKQRGAF